VTEIREPNYRLDLPGEWEQAESLEEGTTVYRDTQGTDTVSVTLLGVKPVYAIADQKMLLEQYMQHRSTFEGGKGGSLEASQPVCEPRGDAFEGAWSAVDAETGRRLRHRVILIGGLLADFRFTAFDTAEDAFAQRAETILGSAGASAE
jgi:hypothetical protein